MYLKESRNIQDFEKLCESDNFKSCKLGQEHKNSLKLFTGTLDSLKTPVSAKFSRLAYFKQMPCGFMKHRQDRNWLNAFLLFIFLFIFIFIFSFIYKARDNTNNKSQLTM